MQGGSRSSGVSFIFNYQHEAGGGPRLHQHLYPKTFIIRSGIALFTVASKSILPNHPANGVAGLLPRNWKPSRKRGRARP
jgi:hypothetical protein